MRKRRLNRGLLPMVLSMVLVASLTLASDKDIVKIQGLVMEQDLKKNMMIVNERSFAWDQNTVVNNENQTRITIDQVKTKSWVYIEGMEDKANKKVLAKKIFLLPRYIDAKERKLYPFMQ